MSKKRYVDIKRCLIDNVGRYKLDNGLFEDTLDTIKVTTLPTTGVSGKTYVKPDGSMWVYESSGGSGGTVEYGVEYTFKETLDADYLWNLLKTGHQETQGGMNCLILISCTGNDGIGAQYENLETNMFVLMVGISPTYVMYAHNVPEATNDIWVSQSEATQIDAPTITFDSSWTYYVDLQDFAPLLQMEGSSTGGQWKCIREGRNVPTPTIVLEYGKTYKFKDTLDADTLNEVFNKSSLIENVSGEMQILAGEKISNLVLIPEIGTENTDMLAICKNNSDNTCVWKGFNLLFGFKWMYLNGTSDMILPNVYSDESGQISTPTITFDSSWTYYVDLQDFAPLIECEVTE